MRPSDTVFPADGREPEGIHYRVIQFECEKGKCILAGVMLAGAGNKSGHRKSPGRADVERLERLGLQKWEGGKNCEDEPECSLHIDPSSGVLPGRVNSG